MKYKELTPKIRKDLKEPQGKLIKGDIPEPYIEAKKHLSNDKLIITVGDITSENALNVGIDVDISILDFKTKRTAYDTNLPDPDIEFNVENPPGYISEELNDSIKEAVNLIKKNGESVQLRVEGEEDLAVIPCVIHAPLGSLVLYGQPEEGLVIIEVDEKSKNFVNDIYGSMKEVDEYEIDN